MKQNIRVGLYEKAMPNTLSLRQKLEYAQKYGYDFLEMSIDESDSKLSRLDWDQNTRFELLSDMKETGIRIETICLSGQRKYPMGSESPNVEAKSMDIIRKAIRLSADLGVRMIQLAGYDVYYTASTSATRERFIKNLKTAVQFAAANKVMLGFETMETPFMDTCKKAMVYVNLLQSPYLTVYPDIGNLTNAALIYNSSIVDDLASAKGHISAMHLKETVPGKYREIPFGTGHVDFTSAVREAINLGVYSYTLEFWHTDEDWENKLEYNRKFIAECFEKSM